MYEIAACPICRSKTVEKTLKVFDDRYGFPGRFDISRCRECRHKFVSAGPLPMDMKDLYTRYYPRALWEIDKYRPLQEVKGFSGWFNGQRRAFAEVAPNSRVLDIGCGFCETLGYHKNRGCEVYGIETDSNVRPLAEKHGFNLHTGVFTKDLYEENFFDYVTMDQVIEHMPDPVSTLTEARRILKPGGALVMTTPHGEGWGTRVFKEKWINWHVPYHLHYFSKKSMRNVARQVRFTVEKMTTITDSEWLYYQERHVLSFPKRDGEPSSFWVPVGARPLSPKRLKVVHAAEKVRALKINHLLTRAFDALGQGDNLFVVLRKA